MAATVAHEMGHNFGMEHDVDYGKTCNCPGNHCVMAPSSGLASFSVYFVVELHPVGRVCQRRCWKTGFDLMTCEGATPVGGESTPTTISS